MLRVDLDELKVDSCKRDIGNVIDFGQYCLCSHDRVDLFKNLDDLNCNVLMFYKKGNLIKTLRYLETLQGMNIRPCSIKTLNERMTEYSYE